MAPRLTVTPTPERADDAVREASFARQTFIWAGVGGVGYTSMYLFTRVVQEVTGMPPVVLTWGLAMTLFSILGLALLGVLGRKRGTQGEPPLAATSPPWSLYNSDWEGSEVRKSLIAWLGIGAGQAGVALLSRVREGAWDTALEPSLTVGLGTVAFAVVGLVVWELLSLEDRRAEAIR